MRLAKFGYRSYPDYLRSAHWHDVRRAYQASGLPQDCMCGETERIQLHHTTYERVGAEELTDLTPLCPTCHAMIHALEARGDIGLDFTGFVNEQRAAKRRAEVEAAEYEKDMGKRRFMAEMEDLRRMAEALEPLAKKIDKRAARDAWLVISKFKAVERRLESRLAPLHG